MNEMKTKAVGAILLAILLMMFCSSAGLLLSSKLMDFIYPGSMDNIMSAPIQAQLILNAVASILIFYLPVHLITQFYLKENWIQSWNMGNVPSTRPIAITILALLSSLPFLGFLLEYMETLDWVREFSGLDQEINNEYLKFLQEIDNVPNTLLMLIGMAIIPAIVEEICFRGFFQQMFGRFMNPYVAIGVTAFLFAIVHMQVAQAPIRMILGVILGYAFYYTKNLWVPIIGHFINNGIIVIQAYVLNKSGASPEELMESGEPISPALAIISLLVCIGLLYSFKLFIPKHEAE